VLDDLAVGALDVFHQPVLQERHGLAPHHHPAADKIVLKAAHCFDEIPVFGQVLFLVGIAGIQEKSFLVLEVGLGR